MIPPIRWQTTGDWSNHHRINHNSLMTRRNPRRNIPRTTYKNSNKRTTIGAIITVLTIIQWWRDVTQGGTYQGLHTKIVTKGLGWGIILFIVSEIRINLTSHRNSTIQPCTSPITKYSNPVSFRSNCNTHTHTHTLWMWVLVIRGFSGYSPWQFSY